ncbi:hypothetical protein [Actinacidiphila acidipaludis]|uniref:Uncharacterized protein n=1 Tax=Actinacidiphila acidipaludis TaxID=2873382 RepID=A0ABS7QD41_9ACTN|nr:hypothetical protein [Streptomyces acidipaludis]MBY8879689.1 hypothetical protein [Streptomyces acidipaludis]
MSSDLSKRRDARSGAEPVTAKSARSLRLRLSVIYAPVFLVLCGLLAWGAAETEYSDTQTVIIAMSTACFVLFFIAMVDAVRLSLQYRRETHPRPSRGAHAM